MLNVRKIRLPIIFYLLFGLIYLQNENPAYDFRWSQFTGSSHFVIYHKTLKWFNSVKPGNRIKLSLDSSQNYIITGSGQIMIPRTGTVQLVPAIFNFKLEGIKKELVVTINDLIVYQHDLIVSQYDKDLELQVIEKALNNLTRELAEYIMKEERKFSGLFEC